MQYIDLSQATDEERLVLFFLIQWAQDKPIEDWYGDTITPHCLVEHTGLDREVVEKALVSLEEKGLSTPLWKEKV